ncbi:major capsid protein [Flavobacterium sp. 102]|uniref:major capsid protein n=1 Tax=Flavobacterium sp. 102 TaxID=2135623 RepID=UPI000EB1C5AD|nr:major capsid protein [Flavobacterium sp. 102]RKS00420.1 major capsid protein E [Flavobacterium sp. 102]
MEKSLFAQWVALYFTPIAQKVVEKINGSKNPLTYLHLLMLRLEFSTTLKWGSLSSNNTMVSADVVAMDSSLPLKKRDSLKKYEGDIPKLGMKLYLNEKTMSDIGILQRTTGQDNEIIRKLFGDVQKCTVGIYEALEFMFLQALSSGVTSITNEDNPGQEIRINFGHPDENKFGAEVVWSDSNAKPIDDIERIVSDARTKGDIIQHIFMDRGTWNVFRTNSQVKENFAFSLGFVGTNVPTPNLEQVNSFMSSSYNIEIHVVDRSVTFEKNGVRTVKYPWAENAVVFTTTMQIGTLTYGRLAEEDHPAKQVDYTKVANYILLSKYHKNDPIREYTSSQALVLPVIDNMDAIYILDCEEAESTSGQTEDDATITIYDDTTVTVANLIVALAAVGVTATVDNTDVELIKMVNKLSKAKETTLKAVLEIPVVDAGTNTTANAATKALDATVTPAGDKTIASVLWTVVSGPGTPGFVDATVVDATANGLVTGTYVFKLTVTDSEGIVASDTVTITATVA